MLNLLLIALCVICVMAVCFMSSATKQYRQRAEHAEACAEADAAAAIDTVTRRRRKRTVTSTQLTIPRTANGVSMALRKAAGPSHLRRAVASIIAPVVDFVLRPEDDTSDTRMLGALSAGLVQAGHDIRSMATAPRPARNPRVEVVN